MNVTEPLDKPSRTIITSEGGTSPSRTKHLIKIKNKYRRLTPVELERLSMFPSHFFTETGKLKNKELYKLSPNERAFLIGNALVTGIK